MMVYQNRTSAFRRWRWVAILLASAGVLYLLRSPETKVAEKPEAPKVAGLVEVVLAEKGKAELPIVVPQNAAPETRELALTLASYLKKMTGASFSIEEGDGSRGIVLGEQARFPALPLSFEAAPSDPRRREEYLLATHPKGLLLVGADLPGTRNAMWDFLGRQGYRQYFPGPAWEIVPSVSRMVAAYHEVQKPDFIMRSIWFSTGAYPEHREHYRDWLAKNRMDSPFHINAGHSYEGFILRNKDRFAENRELFALVKGKRQGPKLNIANPELRRLFTEAALAQLRANPNQLSVSADPSDGGGWDESEEAKAIGSPSNQAVFLANEVAEAISKEFPDRYVGMYAYNLHGEPPSITVHPGVFVLVATGFRGTNLSLQEQMQGWRKQGATLGIRDYLSYAAANYDLPDRCRQAFELEGLAKRLKDYYDWGARLYSGEASNNWGINGLLYYSAARILWDVEQTGFTKSVFEEFLENCFGPVAGEIREYYRALSPAGGPVLEPAFLRRLYDALEAARARHPGAAIDARLDDLTVYVRYLELYRNYAEAQGDQRVAAAREMFSYLYRTRLHSANAGYAIIRDLASRDRFLWDRWSPEEQKALRRGELLWEKRPPYTREEIRAFSREGVKHLPKLDFQPVSYGKDLIPARPILRQEAGLAPGVIGHQSAHHVLIYTWAEAPSTEWRIKVTATTDQKILAQGIHPHVELWASEEAEDRPVSVASSAISPGETVELVVKSPRKGLHWIILSGARWQTVELDPTKAWTLTSLSDIPHASQGGAGASTAYFYVPRGTSVIGAHIPGRGVLRDPSGRVAASFDRNGYVQVEVPSGMDGRLWKLENMRGGNFLLLTVPPYFAASPESLLLPREVVEAEGRR